MGLTVFEIIRIFYAYKVPWRFEILRWTTINWKLRLFISENYSTGSILFRRHFVLYIFHQ